MHSRRVCRHALLWAGVLSLAVHAALLLGFIKPHATSGVLVAPSEPATALRARLVTQAMPARAIVAAMPVADKSPALAAPAATTATPPALTPAYAPAGSGVAVASSAPALPEPAPKEGLPPAPTYLGAKGLDPPPRPLQAIEPVYPESAGLQEGSVVLRLLISSSGDVDEVAVVRATPAGLFEQSALQAFGKAKFSPGYFLGIPVKSQILIEVGYTPINRGGAVSGQAR